jgi:protein TonB
MTANPPTQTDYLVSRSATPRSPVSLAAVLGAHALVLAALLFQASAPEPIQAPKPLTVSLIEDVPEPQPEPPKPDPLPPQPVVKKTPPPPVLAAKPTPAPTPAPPVVVSPPTPEPIPEIVPPPPPPQPVVAAPKPALIAPPTPPRPADYLANPKPPYPALSRRLGEEGVVRLKVFVNPDGSVSRLEIAKSSGFSRLDDSALKTVPNWKFVPAQQAGKAISAWVIVPIAFNLNRS